MTVLKQKIVVADKAGKKDDVYLLVQELKTEEENDKFFYTLYCAGVGNDNQDVAFFEKYVSVVAMKYKRVITLAKTFETYRKKIPEAEKYGLDSHALNKIVCTYVDDVAVLKQRYQCKTMQLPKIAGLMTGNIVKFRPIIPKVLSENPAPFINEVFAVYHAVCICSDFSVKELEEFNKSDECRIFFEDMKYLFGRSFTSESLIMIFKTLCMFRFPSSLKKSESV